MAAFAKAVLAKRQGLPGGLAGDLLGQGSTTAAAATGTTSANNGGVVGGIVNGLAGGVSSLVGGVTSALKLDFGPNFGTGFELDGRLFDVSLSSPPPATSVLRIRRDLKLKTYRVSTSSFSISLSSSSSAQSFVSSLLSSAQPSVSSVLSNAPTSSSLTSSPTTASPTISPSATNVIEAASGGVGTATLTSTVNAAAASTSSTAKPTGFLNNTPLMAGVFTVVGVVGLVLFFILATWFVRRRRHDRFSDEALDFSPATHLNSSSNDDNVGYPNSLHRTNSNGSQFSRSAPTMTYGRESPDRMYGGGGGGYGAAQGYGAAATGGNDYGYYNRLAPPVPSQAYTTRQMQQAFNSGPTIYAQSLPAALRPGAPPAAQNPFEPPNLNRSRSPSPTQSELAYAGYVGANGMDDRVQIGRKVSITKASASVKGRPPALQLPETFGNENAASLKVVNG
ncbi:hypothetical protein K488DRAFT_84632 [Vararia minispora EC-137]|uniref:Uncharacterized protein n=1 Tax=Vararia minispora EC-137 TaxID=1314806 RepID=A0ACB8QPK7_9AGAM|nr:hypothetical protein K488DRAFT_84632 [Vararia minispora EC-137]